MPSLARVGPNGRIVYVHILSIVALETEKY